MESRKRGIFRLDIREMTVIGRKRGMKSNVILSGWEQTMLPMLACDNAEPVTYRAGKVNISMQQPGGVINLQIGST